MNISIKNMYTIEYNQNSTLCRITLQANGHQRITTNFPTAIEENKALLLSSFIYGYLRHRFQAYRHVGLKQQAAQIAQAMAQVKGMCTNYTQLQAWFNRNTAYLQSIEPKRKCIWNSQLNQLLGK